MNDTFPKALGLIILVCFLGFALGESLGEIGVALSNAIITWR
jgi:hypothetical protein